MLCMNSIEDTLDMEDISWFTHLAEKRKWSSRQAHNLKVVGSNPTSAHFFTKKILNYAYRRFYFIAKTN